MDFHEGVLQVSQSLICAKPVKTLVEFCGRKPTLKQEKSMTRNGKTAQNAHQTTMIKELQKIISMTPLEYLKHLNDNYRQSRKETEGDQETRTKQAREDD